MRIFDLFYLIFQNFKSRKSRLVFTILGISIGIGAILFLVSLGYGLQNILLEKITTAESLLTLDVTPPETEVVTLTEQTLSEIKEIPKVEKVSPQAILASQVSLGALTSEATVNLIDPNFFSLAGLLPQKGRAFSERDSQKVVVNSTLAELFNLKEKQALGKKLKFLFFFQTEGGTETISTEEEFEIIGLFEEAEAPPRVFVKRADLKELEIQEYQFAKVKVVSDEFIEEARSKLIEMGFLVSALSDTILQANQIFRVIQIVLGIFGVIALIVAAIGLVNTMTISLLQRINEIGIMRAIGAAPKDIRRIFLGESVLIGFLGGIVGIGLGIGFAETFNWVLNILAQRLGGQTVDLFFYPSWFLVFIVVLSTLVGLIAGIFPARKAGKLNPLAALRYK